MQTPTIHLNGTSKEALLEQWEEAYNALRIAIEKLAAAAPNGRDYYPQGPDAFAKATEEHRERLRKLTTVHAELQELAETVAFE